MPGKHVQNCAISLTLGNLRFQYFKYLLLNIYKQVISKLDRIVTITVQHILQGLKYLLRLKIN